MITLKKRKWISAFHEGKAAVFEVIDILVIYLPLTTNVTAGMCHFKQRNFLEDNFPLEEVRFMLKSQ